MYWINSGLLSIMLMLCGVAFSQDTKLNDTENTAFSNILLIMTDQHQAAALSIAGNTNLSTPNLDKLAKNGIRFENAYVTFPLCVPSRSSIMTGKMPHTLGVNSNEKDEKQMKAEDKKNGLGNVLKAAGYDCAYGGKWHAHEAEMANGNGFEMIAEFGDIGLAEKCISYLSKRKEKTNPFFLVASFDNPHTICEWARNEPLAYGNIPIPGAAKLPGLPVNFEQSETFPEALRLEQTASRRTYPTAQYTENDWLEYRYTYYRLVEKVDQEIGKLLDAVADLGLSDNTLIIFTSDHGDGNASHGWNQKTALFQESVKVPFIVSHQGINHPKNSVDDKLVSNGLDLYPTILDFASVSVPKELLGESLKPFLEGKKEAKAREFVVVETKFGGKHAYGTMGRALIDKKYKYVLYSWGKNREQFFDLENDPFEMNNLVHLESLTQKIDQYRQKLLDWCQETKDIKFLRKLILPTNSKMSSSELFDKPY